MSEKGNTTVAGKPLSKLTYADIVKMQRPEPKPEDATRATDPAALPPPEDQPGQEEESQPLFASKSILAGNTTFASKEEPLAGKFAGKPQKLAGKSASAILLANDNLPAKYELPASIQLPAKQASYPSWQVPKVTVRIPEHLQEILRFIGLSRSLSFQDTVLLAIHTLLANEGLPASGRLQASAGCQPTDQMTDDVGGIQTTSSVIARPDELLEYYAKWAENPIREGDWQSLRKVFGYAPLVVKAGILLSILRTKTRVNSFKYCLGAIDEVAKAGVVNSEAYVQWLEQKVKRNRAGNPAPPRS